MNYFTLGMNYYPGYVFPAKMTEAYSSLEDPEGQDFYKILFWESGTVHIEFNGSAYILTGANALCVNERDRVRILNAYNNSAMILFFQPAVLNSRFGTDIFEHMDGLSGSDYQDLFYLSQFSHTSPLSSKRIALSAAEAAALKKKMQKVGHLLSSQDDPNWPCRCRSYLLETLFSLSRPEEDQESVLPERINSGYSNLTVDIIHYLQTSYNKKVTVDMLSRMFHTNRTTILQDFKKSTGQSINRYLTQLRMTMAAAFLRDTELSVNEICERTGFSDISYFSRSFKKEIRYTPSEYRRFCLAGKAG